MAAQAQPCIEDVNNSLFCNQFGISGPLETGITTAEPCGTILWIFFCCCCFIAFFLRWSHIVHCCFHCEAPQMFCRQRNFACFICMRWSRLWLDFHFWVNYTRVSQLQVNVKSAGGRVCCCLSDSETCFFPPPHLLPHHKTSHGYS